MLLQTNSYIVPKDKRAEHARLMTRFRQTFQRLGGAEFEVYEQTGPNWSGSDSGGRFVQLMRFRDRRHQQFVNQAERTDTAAQRLVQEFCDLINFPYQQQQGLFASGFYVGVVHSTQASDKQIGADEATNPTPAMPALAAPAEDEWDAAPGMVPQVQRDQDVVDAEVSNAADESFGDISMAGDADDATAHPTGTSDPEPTDEPESDTPFTVSDEVADQPDEDDLGELMLDDEDDDFVDLGDSPDDADRQPSRR